MLSIYKASAGSGKTYTLTREYLRMMLRDYHADVDGRLAHSHILAVTFTKKATAEMKKRILQALYTLSTEPTASPYIGELVSDRSLGLDIDTIRVRSHALLIGILQDYTHFSVSTIDGFFQQVIRTFAMELGLPATYDLSMDGEEIIQQAVDDVFLRVRDICDQEDSTTSWLTAFAKENIANDSKWNPKDTVYAFSKELLKEQLMRRMSEVRAFFADKQALQSYQAQLKDICTSTEKDVRRLQKQIKDVLCGVEEVKKAIYSSLSCSPKTLLQKGVNKTFYQALTDPKSLCNVSKLSKSQYAEIVTLYEERLRPLFDEMLCIFDADSSRLCEYRTAAAILDNMYVMGLLQDVAGQVELTNRRLWRLPISDINLLIYQIIDGQDAPFIYERMGQYLRHFMIDEFQDTSNLQWLNFRPLVKEAESSGKPNLIVGDVKQSIYRWRNSDWRLLDTVEHDFDEVRMPAMHDNWRTAPLVVRENEEVIARYSSYVVDELKRRFVDNPDIAKTVQRIYAPENVHQEAHKKLPGVFHLQFFDGKEYQQSCLDILPSLIDQLQGEGFGLGSIAMLVRQSSEAEMVARYLMEHGYRVQSADGLRVQAHPAVQLLVDILREPLAKDDEVLHAHIRDLHPMFTDAEREALDKACELSLYEHVQAVIEILRLNEQEGALPYLTTFLDQVYQFTQNRVADLESFLDYWDRKSQKVTIPTSGATDAIRVMTIHSSKGLEFDVVVLPFLSWNIVQTKHTETIWCTPSEEPFKQMPLVAVDMKESLLTTCFKEDYIQEIASRYIDNLNLTYVAFTRPKYRLYAFGQKCTVSKNGDVNCSTIGKLLSYLYRDELDEDLVYHVQSEGDIRPSIREEVSTSNTRVAEYVSSPIDERLLLRSRSEDDFTEDTPLSTIDLGILMHEWLSYIVVVDDATPALRRMVLSGKVTAVQEQQMLEQWRLLQQLLEREGKTDWFSSRYHVVTERDILTPSGSVYRPDRVMIEGKRAIVIDYKFGQEHKQQYREQVHDYLALLSQMGYQTEGYIVYVALQKIDS